MPAYMLIVIPILDFSLPRQKKMTQQEVEFKLNDMRYEVLVVSWSVFYLIFQVFLYYQMFDQNLWTIFYMAIANGILSVQAFSAAHELLHKFDFSKRFLANIILLLNGYLHFYKSHKHIHHVYVATEKDPSSAPKNMTLYQFFYRSIAGNILYLYNYQTVFTIWCFALYLIFIYSMTMLSFSLVIFWLIQSIVSIILLETVNYIEHYGLKRMGNQSVTDSWDTDFSYMNWIVFRLGFHSHHHVRSRDDYQVLNYNEESPKMPLDYPWMMFLALFPEIYFGLTHPILERK